MSIREIEDAIVQLPPAEVAELTTWLNDYNARVWDDQIERDLETGRLDQLLRKVNQEYESGLARPL